MGCGLADLLNGSAGPPLLVFAFAALQVGGNAVVNHPTVDLEPVPIGLGSCGWNSHESQYGWVESFSQINKGGSAEEFGCLFEETSAEIPTGIGQLVIMREILRQCGQPIRLVGAATPRTSPSKMDG